MSSQAHDPPLHCVSSAQRGVHPRNVNMTGLLASGNVSRGSQPYKNTVCVGKNNACLVGLFIIAAHLVSIVILLPLITADRTSHRTCMQCDTTQFTYPLSRNCTNLRTLHSGTYSSSLWLVLKENDVTTSIWRLLAL